jgi:hypothetical protein
MPGLPLPAPDAGAEHAEHAQLLACQLGAWYPALAPHALRSVVITLPDEFVRYLDSDGIFLGDASAAVSRGGPAVERRAATIAGLPSRTSAPAPRPQLPPRGKADPYADEDDYKDWDEEAAPPSSSSSGSGGGSSSSSTDAPSQEALDWTELCPALVQQIEDAVRQLGGVVVPKLNWSCPSDATWLSPFSNMQCANSEQVRGGGPRFRSLQHAHVHGAGEQAGDAQNNCNNPNQ